MKTLTPILLLLIASCGGMHDTDPVLVRESAFFNTLQANDVPLAPPREGAWRFTHNEALQTFEAYKKQSPVRPTVGKNVIYIKPYGDFSFAKQKILLAAAGYLGIFYQLQVRLLPPVNDEIIPDTARRTRGDGSTQLLAPYFINTLLRQNMPGDAVVVVAVTEKDLYPKPDWNFVFGLGSYHERIGVCSINRLYNNSIDSAKAFKLCLQRLINIASHEIGHMFGLGHCVTNMCVMNGSNSLEESDIQPNRLCSNCLKKLYWNMQFNNKARLLALEDYFYAYGLQRDYLLAKQDWEATHKAVHTNH